VDEETPGSRAFEGGARITVENAVKYFGTVPFDAKSRMREGYAKMVPKPPHEEAAEARGSALQAPQQPEVQGGEGERRT